GFQGVANVSEPNDRSGHGIRSQFTVLYVSFDDRTSPCGTVVFSLRPNLAASIDERASPYCGMDYDHSGRAHYDTACVRGCVGMLVRSMGCLTVLYCIPSARVTHRSHDSVTLGNPL